MAPDMPITGPVPDPTNKPTTLVTKSDITEKYAESVKTTELRSAQLLPTQHPAQKLSAITQPEHSKSIVGPSHQVAPEAVSTEPIARPTMKDSTASATSPAVVQESNVASISSPLHLLSLQIHSSDVQGFQLTDAIVDKNPRGSIAAVAYDDNNILTPYAWSKVTGMKDEFLNYRWARNGKEVANVKIGVWSQDWRSHSRKYITREMRGKWQVELIDDDGNMLAQAAFMVQ